MIESASSAVISGMTNGSAQAPSKLSADAFADAMQRHGANQVAQAQPVAATNAGGGASVATTSGPAPSTGADARARAGLGLGDAENGTRPAEPGDVILNGLQQLRGVFDAREARVSELMNRTSIDTGTMIAVQMEVANFTLLVDVSSKLTGKSTQAFDTLMKGQ